MPLDFALAVADDHYWLPFDPARAVSMPGMMDTILNVGICDRTISPMIRMTGNPRFVWDSYRRLVQTYGEVVFDLSTDPFDRLINEQVQRESVCTIGELDGSALRDLTQQFLELYKDLTGQEFPQEPLSQLVSAVEAVFRSWNSPRAVEYRRLQGIEDHVGTAVTVQAMVFGNMGNTSGSGVAFTRDPASGQNDLYLDFLWNAQGEDVVSGRHILCQGSAIRKWIPTIDRQIRHISKELEQLFHDVQDFEFTIQEGQLYLLQSRSAKRTPWAALQIACDLVDEGLISEQVGMERLADFDLDSLEMVRLDSKQGITPIAIGVPACPGVAVGRIVFEPQAAMAMARDGQRPLLVRHDIATDDVAAMAESQGILTMLGGRTSHAAVVARQLNKVCIVGCRDLVMEQNRRCRIGNQTFSEGDFLSLDGHTGEIYAGQMDVVATRPNELLAVIKRWRQSSQQPSQLVN